MVSQIARSQAILMITLATITHTFLYYRKQIWVQARRSMSEQPDIHARLMSKYQQVPDWWYAIIFGKSIQIGYGAFI